MEKDDDMVHFSKMDLKQLDSIFLKNKKGKESNWKLFQILISSVALAIVGFYLISDPHKNMKEFQSPNTNIVGQGLISKNVFKGTDLNVDYSMAALDNIALDVIQSSFGVKVSYFEIANQVPNGDLTIMQQKEDEAKILPLSAEEFKFLRDFTNKYEKAMVLNNNQSNDAKDRLQILHELSTLEGQSALTFFRENRYKEWSELEKAISESYPTVSPLTLNVMKNFQVSVN